MDQATSVIELRQYVQHWKDHGQSIAFIPTMGNLHAGHMSLIEKGQSLCDRTICSIFVNPMQFGPLEDFDRYPRTLERDCQAVAQGGAQLVFAPDAAEIYPAGMEQGAVIADKRRPPGPRIVTAAFGGNDDAKAEFGVLDRLADTQPAGL